VRLINSYLPRLHTAATRDGTLAAALVRVIGLKDRPQTLLRPDRVARVLRGSLAASRAPAVAPAPHPHVAQARLVESTSGETAAFRQEVP
jgi:hypothetical protein